MSASHPPSPPLRGVVATSMLPVSDLTRALTGRGWHVAVVSGTTSKPDALDAIAAALDFPTHFGRNLDALWDALTDLAAPTALVWTGWEPLAVHAPDDWCGLLAVLKARADADGHPPFAAVFAVTRPAGARPA